MRKKLQKRCPPLKAISWATSCCRHGSCLQKKADSSGPDVLSLASSIVGHSLGRFFHVNDLIAMHIFEHLSNATRPPNFDRLSSWFRSQAEMHSFVAGGKIATRRGYG